MKTQAILMIGAMLISPSVWAVTHVSHATIRNLEQAIQGEANATNRYELFSHKAKQEGYPQVAKLFRAASEAERIHRENHQMALLALDGKSVKIKLEPVDVKNTKQNLEGPIKGEAQERLVMYPQFIKQAEEDKADLVVRTFTFARDTEAEHEQLFKRALSQFGKNPAEDYYVSKISGDTVAIPVGHSFANEKGGGYELIS